VYTDQVSKCPECGEPKPSLFWKKMIALAETLVIIGLLYAGWYYLRANGYLDAFFK
jgi:hypothetical protein